MIFLRLKGKISKFVLSFLLNKKRLKRRKMIFVGNAKMSQRQAQRNLAQKLRNNMQNRTNKFIQKMTQTRPLQLRIICAANNESDSGGWKSIFLVVNNCVGENFCLKNLESCYTVLAV